MFKAKWNIKTSFCCKFTTEFAREKKFENRLIFCEVMGKSLVSYFLTHNVLPAPGLGEDNTCLFVG